jgi:hypothetical protein
VAEHVFSPVQDLPPATTNTPAALQLPAKNRLPLSSGARLDGGTAMPSLTAGRLAGLLGARQAPCISIYLPTNRAYPGAQQNAILYRDLLRQAEEDLRRKHPGATAHALLGRFRDLGDDQAFWMQRQDGLAVFGSADLFELLELPQHVPALAVVADSFHVKPLLRLAQTSDRYQVLCLTRNRARMFEGDRDGLAEIDLAGVPGTMEEVLAASQRRDDERGESPAATGPEAVAVSRPGPFPQAGAGHPGGHPAKGNDSKHDAELFFQSVDRAVWERHSRPSGLPLILAALPVNQALFRKVSHNGQLLPEGVEGDPDAFTPQQLREAAWRLLAPRHQAQLQKLVDDYRVARSRGKGSDDLAEVARAAHDGRVGTLLLDAARHLPGTIDPGDGSPHPAGGQAAGVDDMLDDLGEMVLRQKGTVLVVPVEQVPSKTGLAAIYRY